MISAMTYFDIVNFPFLDGDVPRSTSYGVYRVTDEAFLAETT